MPIPRARFSGVVMSAMNACAVAMLAPATPARLLATKSIGSDDASANRA